MLGLGLRSLVETYGFWGWLLIAASIAAGALAAHWTIRNEEKRAVKKG